MNRARLRLVVLSLAFVAVSVIAVFVVHPQWLLIEDVHVEIAEDSTEFLLFQKVRQSLLEQLEPLKGRYAWSVSLKKIVDLAHKDKRVKSVSIYREFPSTLRLVIAPHTPVLAYLSPDNKLYPIATDATILPPFLQVDAPNLPILRGKELKESPELRERALDLFANIPTDGALNKNNVSEIVFTKADGFKVFVAGAQSEVRFGDSDFGPKVSRVQRVLSYLDSQNIKGRVIDARFSKKVVVRVRNTP